MTISFERKQEYFDKLESLLDSYTKILVVNVDNVGSSQMQQIRMSLRGRAEVLMGKNTLIRKVMNNYLKKNPGHPYEGLLAYVRGNIGFVFTNGDLSEMREVIETNRVPAPARVGSIAPCDVIVPAGPTGCDPGQTSFFQALQISTKIQKGQIEIVSEVLLVKKEDKVGNSEAERRPVAEWVLSMTDGAFADMTRPSSPVTSWMRSALLRAVLRLVPAGSLPPRFIRDRIFGLSISYRDVGTCTNSGETRSTGLFGLPWPSAARLVAGDRLPNLRYCRRGNDKEERLYDLLDSCSSEQTLIVVSRGTMSPEAKADPLAACVKAASSMANVSFKVLMACGRHTPTFSNEESKEESGAKEVTVVELEAPMSPSTPTLDDLLGLSEAEVTILAIRPDSYISLVHRGACSQADIEEGLRVVPQKSSAATTD